MFDDDKFFFCIAHACRPVFATAWKREPGFAVHGHTDLPAPLCFIDLYLDLAWPVVDAFLGIPVGRWSLLITLVPKNPRYPTAQDIGHRLIGDLVRRLYGSNLRLAWTSKQGGIA